MAEISKKKQAALDAALKQINSQFGQGSVNSNANAVTSSAPVTNSHASATNTTSTQQNHSKPKRLDVKWGPFPAAPIRVWVSDNPEQINQQLVKEAANNKVKLKVVDFSVELKRLGSGFIRGDIQQSDPDYHYNSRPSWIGDEDFYLFDNVSSVFRNKYLMNEFVRSVYVLRMILEAQGHRNKEQFVDCYLYDEKRIGLALTCTQSEYKVLNRLHHQYAQVGLNLFEFRCVGID